MRILLVEDSPGDARLIEEAFRDVPNLRVDLTLARRLSEAREALAGEPQPEVVLLDLGLPDASGLEAVTEVVRLAPAVPVVVLTGRDDEEMGLHAVREGAQDYLRKQYLEAESLVRAIRYAIERKRTQNTERLMAEVGTLLASTLDYDDTLRRLSDLAARSLGDYCIIDVVGDDGSILRVPATHPEAAAKDVTDWLLPHLSGSGRSPLLSVMETGEAVRVPSVTPAHLESIAPDEDHLQILLALRPRSYIAVPLLAREQLIGSILFVSSSRSFDEEDQALAEKFARIAAPELANARLYQRAQEAIRARDRVLRIVAHDLRNPLNTIAMSAALLEEPGFSAEQHASQLQIIRRSTDRMDRLIQDLLDVARIESDQLNLDLTYQNPVALVREAVELNTALAIAKGLALEWKTADERPGPICADHGRVLQILSNLLGNAIKFTPAGGQVIAQVESLDAETLFSIRDTGPGISAKDQEHLFTPFWQARRVAADGAGLGLSIAKGLVEAHGGRIWVESEPGEGTTMWFTLPNSCERRSAAGAHRCWVPEVSTDPDVIHGELAGSGAGPHSLKESL